MSYKERAVQYAKEVCRGKRVAGKEVILACSRFIADMKRKDLEMHTAEPDFVITVIEKIMVHKQGESMDGEPLKNKPLLLQDWQIFIVYNLLGFYLKGKKERRYKSAFIEVPRKSGKTLFVAAMAFGIALLERKSGSMIYIVAASLKQASQAFENILYSLQYRGMLQDFRVRDNNAEHSIKYEMLDGDGKVAGSIEIEALASNPKKHDSLLSNIQIIDELHAVSGAEYNRFRESGKSYRNKLCIGITTAGDDTNTFCYGRQEYGVKVLEGTVQDDSLFVFIARADADEKGDVDFLDPIQHEKANPSYGVTISPQDMMNEAREALNDPQQRKDFISRSLDRYTSDLRAYFDIQEFRNSDQQYSWSLDEMAKLPIKWYGGADLSKMHDLTAAALYGEYQGIDIVITHAFFPRVRAAEKAEEDNIPLYGWEDDGWLTMSNDPVVNMGDVVNWFVNMRKRGFKIKEVGHDRKFAGEEYIPLMKKAGFRVEDQPQYFYEKSQGFRHIERAVKSGKLYYLHSEAYEYCVSNVRGVEKTDDAIQYEKVKPTQRIDLFDASVFACIRMLKAGTKKKDASKWWGTDEEAE